MASASYTIIITPTTTVTTLQNGVPKAGIAGGIYSQRFYRLTVPAGQSLLTISISGGSGDCDLYVKQGSQPTTSSYEFASFVAGNSETVTINNPTAGDWYVTLEAWDNYSGVTLTATYSARVLLLLHGINSSPVTWHDLTQNMFNNSSADIFGTNIDSTPTAKNGVFCYRLEFGSYDGDASASAGLDGITSASAPLPSGGISPMPTGVGNTAGDFTSFENLGLEIKNAISRLMTRHGTHIQVVLVGHSRGGLAARAFLQNTSYTTERQKVVALLTTGTPHRGSRLAKIYGYLAENPHSTSGTLPQDWKTVEWMINKDIIRLDVRRPTMRELAFDSDAIKSLNLNIGNLLSSMKCSALVYSNVPLGTLGENSGVHYSVFPGATFFGYGEQFTQGAQNSTIGMGQTPENFIGDGVVEADNQTFTDLAGFSGSKVDATTVTTPTVYHAGHTPDHFETGRFGDILLKLKQLVDWWNN